MEGASVKTPIPNAETEIRLESTREARGSICESKDLYRSFDDNHNLIWADKLDQTTGTNETENLKFAVIAYHEDNCGTVWDLIIANRNYTANLIVIIDDGIDRIVVQSRLLMYFLEYVLDGYPGLTITMPNATFYEPFMPFVHRWDKFNSARCYEDEETQSHIELLEEVLEDSYAFTAALDARGRCLKDGMVTYAHLWAMFEPQCLVYSSSTQFGNANPVAMRLIDSQFCNRHEKLGPCYQLNCQMMDWDGLRYASVVSPRFIMPFAGQRAISELECYPLSFHRDKGMMREKLIARGRRLDDLIGSGRRHAHRAYNGLAIERVMEGPSVMHVNGRIMIDTLAYFNANSWLHSSTEFRPVSESCEPRSYRPCQFTSNTTSCINDGLGDEEAIIKARIPLYGEQPLICTPVVRGYDLTGGMWLEFLIDCISDIDFRLDIHGPILSEPEEETLLAVARRYKSNIANIERCNTTAPTNTPRLDPKMVDKRNGAVVTLLQGTPNSGKSYTAACVASRVHAPLISIHAANLGNDAFFTKAVPRLEATVKLATRWGAVLLIECCDTWLKAARKDRGELEHACIVAALRGVIERHCHSLVLFLTASPNTETVGWDRGLEDLIHFRLSFGPPGEAGRQAVWIQALRGWGDKYKNCYGYDYDIDIDVKVLKILVRIPIPPRDIVAIVEAAGLLLPPLGESDDSESSRREEGNKKKRRVRDGRAVVVDMDDDNALEVRKKERGEKRQDGDENVMRNTPKRVLKFRHLQMLLRSRGYRVY